MTGPDYDEDEPEDFRPAPHPDDRLWRHPSEIAAMNAALANAETLEVPAIEIVDDEEPRRFRKQTVLAVAAGLAVVGAAALTLGVVSTRDVSPNAIATSQVANSLASEAAPSGRQPQTQTAGVAADTSEGEALLTSRVHDLVASSLPRIQAATPSGMLEGSGVFVTDGGYIATSADLVASAEYILAWTEDGQRWKAHVVAVDPISDVAVLQIDSQDWPAAALANNDLRSGQYAFALDHLDDTISLGEVISVAGPTVNIDQPAAMPGSAIVDDTGAVIAMVTNHASHSVATPAWLLEQVAVDLIASGETTHTWLGVIVDPTESPTDMALVASVVEDSPAADAGLRAGDLIDSVNNNPTPDAASLYREVHEAGPGDNAVLTVTRNGSRRIIIATLAELPG